MKASVTTKPDFAPGKEQELPGPRFSYLGGWDVAPDGSRLVVVGRLESGDRSGSQIESAEVQELRVVTDWFQELERSRP